MCRILIFGGTTEGRKLAEFCIDNKIYAYVSVATPYGRKLLNSSKFLHILVGRKDEAEIEEFIVKNGIEIVMDATHPYAVEAGRNISAACKKCSVKCVRILREESNLCEYGRYFDDIESIIKYLNTSSYGNILITTGSNDLEKFCSIKNYAERCMVRVLPTQEIMERCKALGFDKESVIAERGPFSEEQNIRHLKKCRAKYLITKESGTVGGFTAKVSATEKCGAQLLIIKRPTESGVSLEEAKKILMSERSNV